MLTARNRVDDRVQCLDAGSDDYLAKPFSFPELSARIRALLRRSRLPAESVLRIADLELDRVERRVTRAGRVIELTSKEFALLEYLLRNAGRRVTRSMIIEHVWNLSFDSATNLVDVYIAYTAAVLMASRMLGIDGDDAKQQMWDALGEICNMMAGNFKNMLTGMADHCMLSVPTGMTGATTASTPWRMRGLWSLP